MTTTEQKQKLLKAKVALAMRDEFGKVPREEEIEDICRTLRISRATLYRYVKMGKNRQDKDN